MSDGMMRRMHDTTPPSPQSISDDARHLMAALAAAMTGTAVTQSSIDGNGMPLGELLVDLRIHIDRFLAGETRAKSV
jgi:hypothetical protein